MIQKSYENLNSWIKQNGWSGYDPYDIKGHPFVLKLIKKSSKSYLITILRELLFEIFNIFPFFSRKILNIQPEINAKAMGLFAKAYLDLYISTKKIDYLNNSKECTDWLKANYVPNQIGMAWGYPFDWQSKQLIAKNTPNGIVTTAVGDAFWSWYKFSNEQVYLDICKEICYFLESLPKDSISENKICFAYTPIFQNHVHNLNLFVAEFLIKVGSETHNKNWINLGNKATNYTISDQLDNGSFDYNGPPEKPNNFVDNYHSGFVLRMLYSIWKLTQREDVFTSLEKCYKHYISNFFENNTVPKLKPNQKYRIDIHSCAESINCLCELSETFPEGAEIAKNVLIWTVNNLQDKKGYFYAGFYKSKILKVPFILKIPYIRWAQAWMLKAYSNYIKHVKQLKNNS